MSDLLMLAAALRASSDQALTATLSRRNSYGSPKDFFDLAQGLLSAKSLLPAITKLSGSEARALAAVIGIRPNDDLNFAAAIESLSELALIYQSDSTDAPVAYQSVTEMATPILSKLAQPMPQSPATGLLVLPLQEPILGLAAIAAFETQQAICEVILDAGLHQLRHTGKSGFGVADVKRLAAHLQRTNQAIRGYYRLAQQIGRASCRERVSSPV